jgi:hypothetical protein
VWKALACTKIWDRKMGCGFHFSAIDFSALSRLSTVSWIIANGDCLKYHKFAVVTTAHDRVVGEGCSQ